MIPVGYTLRFLAWPIAAWLLGIEVVSLLVRLYFEYIVAIDGLAFLFGIPWDVFEVITPGGAFGALVSLTIVVVLCSYSRGKQLVERLDPDLRRDRSPVGRMNEEHRKLANVFRAFTRAQKRSRLDHLVRPRAAGFLGFVLFLTILQFPFAVGDWLLGKFWGVVWPRRRLPHLPSRPGSGDAFGDGAGPEPPPFDATAPSDSPEYDAQYSSTRRQS